jgi:hypothetical protein
MSVNQYWSFEDGTTDNWSTAANSGFAGTIAASTTQAHSGTYSLLYTCTSVGTSGGCSPSSPDGSVMPCSAGQQVFFSAWVYSSVAQTLQPKIQWSNSSGTYVSQTGTTAAVLANTWTQVYVSGTCPTTANIVQANFQPFMQVSGGLTVGTLLYVDDVYGQVGLTSSFYDDFTASTLDTSSWLILSNSSRTGNAEQEIYEPAGVSLDGSAQGNLLLTANSFANLGSSNQQLTGTSTTVVSGTLSTTTSTITLASTTNYPASGGVCNITHNGINYLVNYASVSGATLTGCTLYSGGPVTLSSGDPIYFAFVYQSGEINSFHQYLYGGFFARCKFPPGAGLWPAFWLVQNGGSVEEIDIIEFLGSGPTSLHNTYIWSYSPKEQTANNAISIGEDLSAGWHTYGVIWTPLGLTWIFDDQVTKTFSYHDATLAGTVIPYEPMNIILNLAVGSNSSFGGGISAQTAFPAVFEVDWVKVFPVSPGFLGTPGNRYRLTT